MMLPVDPPERDDDIDVDEIMRRIVAKRPPDFVERMEARFAAGERSDSAPKNRRQRRLEARHQVRYGK